MAPDPPQLRSQLLTWLLVPLFLLLAVDMLASYWMATRFSQRAYDRSLMEIARELSLHLASAGGAPRLDLPDSSRKILLSDPDDRIRYELATAEGRHLEGDALPAAPAGGASPFFDARVDGEAVRVVELRIEPGDAGSRPAALVRVAETVGKRKVLAGEMVLNVVAPQALSIFVAGLVVWIGVVHGLRPLEKLRRTVMERRHDDRSPIAADDVPAEVRPLLESINELVARLDHAFEIQGRFISDAAHQLKTPVTVLKTELELALREDEPARARQAVLNSRAALERLSRVVSQLLSLARNAPDVGTIHIAPLDLNALALDVSQVWVPEALKKRIDLGFEAAPGPVTIAGDSPRLREMLDNLVDNAVRYTPEGGRVTVHVHEGPAPRIDVRDDGPRIPADERERVFERFHRMLGNMEEGSGLGLAIAREIASIHGAAIELTDDADGVGNCFRVVFPQA